MAFLKRVLALGVAILPLAGCDLLREPTILDFAEDQLLVAGMLEAGSPTASVLLVRVAPRAPPASATFPDVVLPVSGATVRLVSGADTVMLAENAAGVPRCYAGSFFQQETPAGPGCYGAAIPGGIVAGRQFSLLVAVPGGGEVQGVTVVPDTVPLLEPAPYARFTAVPDLIDDADGVAQVPVRWGGAEAGGLRITMAHAAVFEGGERVPDGDCNLPSRTLPMYEPLRDHSATFQLRYVDCNVVGPDRRQIRWDSIHAHLVVAAYDSAYARYERSWGGDATSRRDAAVGLSGAIGVFAASARSRVPVVILRAAAGDP